MSVELRFFVPGIPASQGSMKCVGRNGKHQLIPDNPPKLKTWRQAVQRRAEEAAEHANWARLDTADIRLVFRLTRPQAHYRDGRYSHLLRDDAPDYPAKKGLDIDKAIRAVFDALTASAVISDDACIVTITAAKRWADQQHVPGVNVVLTEPPRLQLALAIETAS